MKTSEEMARQIGKFEGLRLKPYKCPAGVWTVGYGHTGADVTERGVNVSGVWKKEITEAYALELLQRDLAGAEREVARLEAEGVKLWPCEFDALVSFVYNCGSGNFRSSTLRKVLLAGSWRQVDVAEQLMRWNKASGKVLPGLTVRRAVEALWFVCGKDFVESFENKAVEIVMKWTEKRNV